MPRPLPASLSVLLVAATLAACTPDGPPTAPHQPTVEELVALLASRPELGRVARAGG